jgi:hypothetical protein
VRAVDEHGGRDTDQLETAGRGHLCESVGDDIGRDRLSAGADERLDGGDGQGRVVPLVRAVQRQVEIVVCRREAPHAELLSADGERCS